ncbi:lipase family protein [Mycobacterium deserti]|uniref:Lipase family protein n=1 Tax=Mycobacterium deserti TaxID=2978347 RepID=A0ABT2MHM5_9MYCO|nr:lipase family protein [Mycobacterium deserti]MCT7660895.1 lipase family protein [Mycobacterium deserti]
MSDLLRSSRMGWRACVAFAAVVAALSACSGGVPTYAPDYERPSRELTPTFEGAPVLPPPDLTDDGPGSLVRVEPVSGNASFDNSNSTAVRIVYRSTSGAAGTPTEVSGLVAVPPGQPPAGGWPVVSFGHEMIGVQPKCAPSLVGDFLGYAGQMTTFLNRGYVVVLSDFQGLGIEGQPHSVVDSAALGNNMIDAARAARRVLPSAGTRWAAFGVGEGGLAAWAAAERAPTYGAGLEMVGSVAVSPYADLTPLVDAAAAGTLAPGEQSRLYMLALQSLANTSPGFDLDAYRTGLATERWATVTDCAPRNPNEALRLLTEIPRDDFRPRDAGATDDLRRRLGDAAVPTGPPAPGSVPVLVIYGTDDAVVPAAGIDRAVVRACAEGDPVEVMRRIGDSKPVNDQVIGSALSWLLARFDGQQLGDVCVGAT